MKYRMVKMRRGQIVAVDLIFAALIFTILLTAIILFWDRGEAKIQERATVNEMENRLVQISGLLVGCGGWPPDWEANVSSVEVLGLAQADRVLAADKVAAFVNLTHSDYGQVRELLGIQQYGFHFLLEDLNGTTLIEGGTRPTGHWVVSTTRYVEYNGKTAQAGFSIWK